ncbi:transcription factor Adf-1-like isoform X2 [Sitophilus oryzae]|uniref:Transcription factor Adf-1-like isoform X2 n=1 Tax=Sitophilus oryzae TaxID=7048 RepID=A0A6J2YBP1_SITOR|nr:transcription factor Adf-1-like isoform X2 [Sitophilus oryzae]XP_030760340.1 transcription factor Adf-1-like isoform X2 [Sitophilus oryzae]
MEVLEDTRVDIHLFLSLVEGFKHLYDIKHKDYKDGQKKENSWREIGTAMDISVEEAKRIWKLLRDTYVRKKKAEPSGSQGGLARPWPYMQAMQFYDSCRVQRRTVSNVKLPISRPSTCATASTSTSTVWDSMSTIVSSCAETQSQAQDSQLVEESENTIEKEQVVKETEKSKLALEDGIGHFRKRKVQANGSEINEIVGLAKTIVSNMNSTVGPINAAFGKFVSIRLDEMSSEIAKQKRLRIMEILED